jgi:UDP-2,3-diacylglucosamine hydrolase
MHYFVSDIHLGSGDKGEQRRVERLFLDFLAKIENDAETLFLVGDIFDFWFEYKQVVPKGFVRVLGRLAELSDKGVRIVMLTGNHDMWVGNYLTEECGVEVYTKPIFEVVAGKRLFLAHGDNMKINGQPLLRLMNAVFRSKIARVLFSWIVHPDLALKFGHWWSGKSRKSHKHKDGRMSVDRLDSLVEYAREHKRVCGDVEAYIFGHMHLPHRHTDADLDVLFMSSWSGRKATYVTMDADSKLELKTFDIDETISGVAE